MSSFQLFAMDPEPVKDPAVTVGDFTTTPNAKDKQKKSESFMSQAKSLVDKADNVEKVLYGIIGTTGTLLAGMAAYKTIKTIPTILKWTGILGVTVTGVAALCVGAKKLFSKPQSKDDSTDEKSPKRSWLQWAQQTVASASDRCSKLTGWCKGLFKSKASKKPEEEEEEEEEGQEPVPAE